MRETVTFCGLLVLYVSVTSGWDPDAGVVTSWTKTNITRVVASSGQGEASKANDGDDSTHWTSRGCMPGGFYLNNQLTNLLYEACEQGRCSSSSSDRSQANQVTDGDTNTGHRVMPPARRRLQPNILRPARFNINLLFRRDLRDLTVRGTYNAPTELIIRNGLNETVVATLTSADSYHVRDFNTTLTPATSVTLRSFGEFTLYEVGAVGPAGCVERIYVDMGAMQHVRVVRTRHWAGGHGLSSKLLASGDSVNWHTLSDLDPNALQPVVTYLPNGMTFRYLAVEHRQDETNYAKVYVWEMDAYPDGGMYGRAPWPPRPNPASLREMLGVNAIWGWGWGRSSTTLSPGQGAALYAPIASYGRNYHNLNWDVRDPDNHPNYTGMAQGHGTDAQSWLNWDTEYGRWVAANVSVHVSVQFLAKTFPVSVWDQPYQAAFQYGQAFAKHFGPTHGNGLVRSVEVGNEPWDYPADFYSTVLEGMASGFKAGDPSMVVMPGAFQAHDLRSTGNYIGTRVTQQLADKIDVINSHHYSWRQHSDGSRHATYPEDPAGTFNEIHSIIRWRDTNTPSKPLWMTEWGWDSAGGGQQCTSFSECTTEFAASAYAARGLLLHARLGVARSTWFFYGNLDDCDDHVFCRSGLTSSKTANFTKKGPYHTLRHLTRLLGHTHFLSMIQENDDAYVYVFGTVHPTQTSTHLVAWRPVDASTSDGTSESTISFTFSYTPAKAWRLRMDDQEPETALPTVQKTRWTRWTMSVAAMPTVVQLMPRENIIG